MDIAVKLPAMMVNPPKNLTFNAFILSTFPSDNDCNKSIPVTVSQPPAKVSKNPDRLPRVA